VIKVLSREFIFSLVLVSALSMSAWAQEIPFDPSVPVNPNPSWSPAPNSLEPAPPDESEIKSELDAMPAATPIPVTPATNQPRKRAELSGLGTLAPFSDIAVINKRFLPKTKRFEFFPNFGLVMNDAFFNNIVFGGRFGYHFNEHYGVEALATGFSTTSKTVTSELNSERFVGTAALATPTSYYGLDFKWSPIYGKVGFTNTKIVPFDLYFLLGGGVTGTNQGTQPPTLHLGAGQLFAITQWLAFRWDISWFAYKSDTSVTSRPSGTFTNLHGTIGMSFFFPGAKYR